MTGKLNEWKETELFDMLIEKFVPKAKKKEEPKEDPEQESEEDTSEEGNLDDKNLANNTPPVGDTTRGDIIAQAVHNKKKAKK